MALGARPAAIRRVRRPDRVSSFSPRRLAHRQGRGAAEQRRRVLRQPEEAQRLEPDPPVEADDADLCDGGWLRQ
jgi:hypothetical protein